MNACRFLLTGLAWGLVLPALLPATTVDAPDIDALIRQSDYVVRAVVKSATAEWREHAGQRYIGTRVELEIREVVKGAPPSPLVIDLIGGRVGEDELAIQGMPKFHAGDENVLFVHGENRRMLPLVAMMHGVYPIVREAGSGEAYVLRSNGLPLYSAQDVSLPMDRPSAVKQQNPSARPLTAGAFIRQIRDRVTPAQPTNREK